MLIDKKDQNNKFDFSFMSAMDEYVRRRNQSLEDGLGYIKKRKEELAENHVLKCILNLRRLIRYNRRI